MSYVARQNDEFERLVNALHEPAVSPLEKTKSESAPLRCDILFSILQIMSNLAWHIHVNCIIGVRRND